MKLALQHSLNWSDKPVPSSLRAPFLKQVAIRPEKIDRNPFPFNRFPKLLGDDFKLEFRRPFTIFVGENGSGKSTILQAVAELAGFHAGGGDSGYQLQNTSDQSSSELAKALRPAWLPKVSHGFFFRADTFAEVARYIDDEGNPKIHDFIPLWERSHGEAFLAVFADRFKPSKRCLYLMDEPESALSPKHQMALLRLLRQWEETGNAQIILATHSPILMSYPNADLLWFNNERIEPIQYEEIEHVKIMRAFLANPAHYIDLLFDEGGKP